MAVGTYALTSVAEILTWLGEDAYSNAFWIYFSGTTGTNTCQVNEDSFVLIDEDTVGGTTTFDITSASYNTLTLLIAGINAVTGWNAGLIYNGTADSGDLRIIGALDCDGAANEQTIQIKDVYKIERLIDRATDFIERYCNRKLVSRAYTQEVYNGNGRANLILREYPVTQVDSVAIGRTNAFSVKYSTACTTAFIEANSTNVILTVDGTATNIAIGSNTIDQLIVLIDAQAGWDATILNSNYGSLLASEIINMPALFCKDPDFGYVEIPDDYLSGYYLESDTDEWLNNGTLIYWGGFTGGSQNVFVTYNAGYSSTPASLEEAAIRLVSLRYNESGGDLGMKKESKGDYSYEKFDFNLSDIRDAWPPELKTEIDLFKRRII